MSKTKIVVLQMKELIYTAIFIILGILLILLLVFMFLPKKHNVASVNSDNCYVAGKYTSELTLNNSNMSIEVVVDENHINSVKLVNLADSITTMYPLIEPALKDIATQLYNNVDVNELTLSNDCKFTQTLLIDAIKSTLEKAKT